MRSVREDRGRNFLNLKFLQGLEGFLDFLALSQPRFFFFREKKSINQLSNLTFRVRINRVRAQQFVKQFFFPEYFFFFFYID